MQAMKKLKITEMERLTTEAFRRETKLPIVVVLDDVRSMNNVGSVFRTADAFRLEGLVLPILIFTRLPSVLRIRSLGLMLPTALRPYVSFVLRATKSWRWSRLTTACRWRPSPLSQGCAMPLS